MEDYRKAVPWAAQMALREIIGKTPLADMLTGREAIGADLRLLIDARTHDWGILVKSVEICNGTIPPNLEDVMSWQAQAEDRLLIWASGRFAVDRTARGGRPVQISRSTRYPTHGTVTMISG